jgi:MFS family permease
MAAALLHRDFRVLWFGACTSSIGTWMQSLAENWLVLSLTSSAFFLGLDAFLQQLPIMLFTLIGGVFADRYDRRQTLMSSQWVQLTCAASLALLVHFHVVHIWHILALSFLTGCAQAFGGPAYQSLIPSLVGTKDLTNAIALNSIQFNVARMVGPLLAGAALAAFSHWGMPEMTAYAACFGLNALSFLAPIAALSFLARGGMVSAPSSETVLQSLRTGLKVVHDDKGLRGLVTLGFIGSFCAMPLVTFLPVFAKSVFHQDAKGYSVLLAAFGIGAIGGAVGTAWIGNVRRKGIVAVSMQMAFGALMAGFALSRNPILSYALLALAGASLMVVFAMFMTLVQANVDDRLRGRVVSVYSLAFRGAMPLGNLLAGLVAAVVTAPRVLIANGLVMVGVGAVVLLRPLGSRIRKL